MIFLKLKGEENIQEVLNEYHIVRTSWLYSKKYGKNFYKTILEKAKKGETLKITNKQKGCPTKTDSLTNFIISTLIINDNEFGVYHFTDDIKMTWYNFAEKILEDNDLNNTTNIVKDNNYCSFVKRPTNSILYTYRLEP